MATQDRSPSLIIGQQWSALAELTSTSTQNDDDDGDKDDKKMSSDSMKLWKQDMGLFGFCPSRDEFSLVVCEKCNLLVKPQALKQHIESRHGPTDLSSLGNIPASALNSELGKKLLMPLPTKCLTPPQTTTPSVRQVSGTFKPVSSGWPPTKASLKQVPASLKNISAPILGVSMKISPLKSVRSGNRITPAVAATTTATPATSAASNLVVKVEKLEKVLTSSSKPDLRAGDSAIPPSNISDNSLSLDSTTKISTLVNGSVKSAISFTTPSSTPAISSPSLLPTPVLVAVTKQLTDASISTKCGTTFVSTMSLTKPLMIAPVIAVGSAGTVAQRPLSSAKSTKATKDQKERKFLPCKDREYDANKHCGVMFSETGKQCTRSLTCKTHSLSLRRAVAGRSKSFDDLLKEHKAAKEALLKAKAELQNANAAAASNRVLVSSATISPTLLGLKQQVTPVIAQQDCKILHATSLSGALRTAVPSNSVPPTTNFAKPISMFQRFSSSAILPPAITVTEESVVRQESSTRLPSSSSFQYEPHSEQQDTKLHPNFLSHHPRPMANTQFAGRLNDRGCLLFSRKMDYIRAALLSALERQLNPPPHKKLCVESNLPQESQVLASSQDPYEFNMVDSSGVATYTLNASLVNASKSAIIKTKSKLPTSPVAAASSTHPLSLSRSSGAVAIPLSLSSSTYSTLCTTAVTVSSALSSGLALSWPVKSRDCVTSPCSSAFLSPVLSSTPVTNSGKRKRSGSSGSSNNQLVSIAGSNGALPAGQSISVSVSSASIAAGTGLQTGLAGILTPTSLNSHQTANMIAIPSVSLANTNIGQLSAAKFTSSPRVASPATAHRNNIFKDFNLVLTGIDPSLVNGQYVNITGAQLAELAASQGQTLFLNSFISSGTNCSATPGNTSTLNLTSSLPTSKQGKRSRSSGLKFHQTLANSTKITASALEGLKIIPSSSVITSGSLPSSAVLVDSGSLQGAMLTSVALATGGTTPTLVAIASSTANSNSGTVSRNPTQVLCADSPSIVSSSALVNGVTNSSYEKSASQQQHHHHPSSSKSHHHHQNSKSQQQGIALGSVIQASPSIAVPIPSGSAAQLCSSQAIFKPGGTFNLATKTVGGKLTMQPVSLTFPINVSQAGLAALTSGRPQQQQQQQPQHTLLVTTSGGGGGDIDSAAV